MTREQGMLPRRKVIQSVPAAAALGLAGCIGSGDGSGSSDPTTWTIGANAQGSGFWGLSQVLQQLYRQSSDQLRLSAQTTGGARANYEQFSRGENDLTGTSLTVLEAAYNQTGSYEGVELDPVPAQGWTFAFTNNFMTARKGTDIETFEDIRGKKVWPFYPGSSLRVTTEAVFREFGLWEDINIVNLDTSQIAGAVAEGRVDVAGSTGLSGRSVPGWNVEVDQRADMRMLTMTDEQKSAIQDMNDLAYSEVEPYGWEQDLGISGEVGSWGDQFVMIYRPDLDPDLVYHSMRVMHDNFDRVYEDSTLVPDVKATPEKYVSGHLDEFPLHEGVARFYDELGILQDDWIVGVEEWEN